MSKVFLSYADAMSQSHKGTSSQSHMSESEWLPTILKVSGATTHFQTLTSIEPQMFRTKQELLTKQNKIDNCSKKPISTKDLLRAHPMTRCIFKTCYQKLVAAKCNEITFGRSVIPTDLFSGTGQVPSPGK